MVRVYKLNNEAAPFHCRTSRNGWGGFDAGGGFL
jgi:hypothetical protein